MGGGGGPIGDVFSNVTGIATKALEPVMKPLSEAIQPIAEAIPGGEYIVPAALAMIPGAGPYLAGGYHMGQGDPVAAMMSAGLGGFGGGGNPFGSGGVQTGGFSPSNLLASTPKFLQQAGTQTLQDKVTEQIIKTALREGLGYLGEKTGLVEDSDQAKAMTAPFTTGPNLGEGILPQSGDMLAQGMLQKVGQSLDPVELARVKNPLDVIKILSEQGLGTDWLPKNKDGTTDWKKVMKWVAIGGAAGAGLYALAGGMEGEPQELPEKTQEYWAGYDYGDPLATSGQKGSILGDMAYVTDPETGKITGYKDMPGAQTILGRYKEFTENLEGKDKEAFDEAQSAAHGGLMSLKDGGSTDIEQIKQDKEKFRDMYMADMDNSERVQRTMDILNMTERGDLPTDPDAKGVDLEKYPRGIADMMRRYMEQQVPEPRKEEFMDRGPEYGVMRDPEFWGEPAEKYKALPNLEPEFDTRPSQEERLRQAQREAIIDYEIKERLRKERERRGTSPEGLGPEGFYRRRPSVEVNPMAGGGFPRKTGAINGPGTATSDSIPAMLSDGEFVMTADAVRGAGMGNRMAGAKKMYDMMNKFEGMA